MKGSLFFSSLFLCHVLFANHQTITYEYGLRAVIPKIFGESHRFTQRDGGKKVTINQRALHRADYTPFPSIAQGMFGNVLINKNKLSWGLGYEFNYDYHSLSYQNYQNNRNGMEDLSVKIQNHTLYLLGRFNLRDEFKRSVFVGLKTGLHLSGLGVSDQISNTSFSIARSERDSFRVINIDTWTPGVMAAFQVGVKIYFFPKLIKSFKPGLKIVAEIKVSTPTHAAHKQILSGDQKSVTGKDPSIEYRTHYSTVGIQFILFTDFYRKRLLVTREPTRESDDYNLE